MDDNKFEQLTKNNKNLSTLVIILGIVIIALLAYIAFAPKILKDTSLTSVVKKDSDITDINSNDDYSLKKDYYDEDYDDNDEEHDDDYDDDEEYINKNAETKIINIIDKAQENKSLKILSVNYIEDSFETIIAKVKNISEKTYYDSFAFLVFLDSNNNPIYVVESSLISRFKNNSDTYLEFYDPNLSQLDYSSFTIIISNYEEEDEDYRKHSNLFDSIKFKHSIVTNSSNDKKIKISGTNPSSEDLDVYFTIAYYKDNDVFFIDGTYIEMKANSDFEDTIDYCTEFYNNADFPEGYSYDIVIDSIAPLSDDS